MSGIVGVVDNDGQDTRAFLEGMVKPLVFHSHSQVDRWSDSSVGLCRVRGGIDNPETQPVYNRDKSQCIILFGECFGYEKQKQELERRGHIFEFENNDAEFCLKLYEEYGEKAFSNLNGSFCFAIYNRRTRELLLVSDHLGSRPLFYGCTPSGQILFSTQVSSILYSSEISRQLDTSALFEFCTLQRVLGDKTFHKGVSMLPPASVLRYWGGRSVITPYWYFHYKPQAGSMDEYADELAETVLRSISRMTRDVGKTAVLLSGGLDARMIVAAVDERLVCYSFGDYENSEIKAAQQIAKAGGFDFHFLGREPDHYVNLLDMAIEVGSGMFPFNHAHGVGFLEEIAKECDVVTHGFYIERFFRGSCLPRIPVEFFNVKVKKELDPNVTLDSLPDRIFNREFSLLDRGVERIFTSDAKKLWRTSLRTSALETVSEASASSPNVYDQFLWPDVYCARNVTCLFPVSIRPFMTERSFAFDREIIELHLKTPLKMRLDDRLWLKAMERLNKEVAHSVNANTGFSPYMPTGIISGIGAAKGYMNNLPLLWRLVKNVAREKNPYGAQGLSPISWPRYDWLIRNNPKLLERLNGTISSPDALPQDIFDRKQIDGLLNEHLKGKAHYRMILFMLLTFGLWNKKYGVT